MLTSCKHLFDLRCRLTVIVGLEHDGKVYIGGDSAVSFDGRTSIGIENKVMRVGDFIMGDTGNLRTAQVVQHNLKVRKRKIGESTDAYLVNGFAKGMQSCLTKHNCLEKGSPDDTSHNSFLVGYEGKLYLFASDFSLHRAASGYFAVGCGAPYALGALVALNRIELPPKEKLEHAMAIAAQFQPSWIAPPFTVLEN